MARIYDPEDSTCRSGKLQGRITFATNPARIGRIDEQNYTTTNMNLFFYKPRNPILKKYIEGYYFINDYLNNATEEYYTFPNNYSILTISKNSTLTFLSDKIHIRPSPQESLFVSLVYRYVNPIRVMYEKPIEEITFYFKPLCLNYFVENSKKIYSEQDKTSLEETFPDIRKRMNEVFQEKNRDNQIEILENYWLSIFKNKDLNIMHKILLNVESNMRIDEVASHYNISRKHLNTLFLKYIGKPAVEYRKIHRFRKSLNNNRELKNFTELSYENLFYDQSHLIKDFKALTGISPKIFFKNINIDNENIWLYI